VTGPQVQLNIEPGCGLGGIFELHGRAWLQKPTAALEAELLHELDSFACELCARGERIKVTVNGRRIVDFDDRAPENKFLAPGFFALQIHGGGHLKVLFREISVRTLE
jgi:3-keto-disaccharide hydrolase